jgi:hypothetical protein
MLDYIWVLPVLWLLFGMPWLDERTKKRSERNHKRRMLEWELLELNARRGREGLEAKLLADLKMVQAMSVMRGLTSEEGTTGEDVLRAIKGEVPDGADRMPLATSDDRDIGPLWPLTKSKYDKRRRDLARRRDRGDGGPGERGHRGDEHARRRARLRRG